MPKNNDKKSKNICNRTEFKSKLIIFSFYAVQNMSQQLIINFT